MGHLLEWQCCCTYGPFMSADACGQGRGQDPGLRFGVLPPSLMGALRMGKLLSGTPPPPPARAHDRLPFQLGSWFPCTRVAPARSPRRMTWGLPTCQPPLLGSMCLCSMGIPHMSQAGEQRGTGLDLRLRSTSNPKGSGSYTSEASGFPGKEMRQKRRLPAQSPLGVACPHEEDPPQVEKRGRPPVLPTSNSSHLLVSSRETKSIPPATPGEGGIFPLSSVSALPVASQSRSPHGPSSSPVFPRSTSPAHELVRNYLPSLKPQA